MKKTHSYHCLAITGGIGSGKSTVLNYFKEKGFLTISADDLVVELYQNKFPYSLSLFSDIDKQFNTSFEKLGYIDKNILRPIIKDYPDGFNLIANITSRYIQQAINDTFHKYKSSSKIIFEIPLLIEQKQHVNFYKTLAVYADIDVRIKRILKRNPNLNVEYIIKTIQSQLSDKEKLQVVDYKINNSKDVLFLYKQLDMILNDIVDIYK